MTPRAYERDPEKRTLVPPPLPLPKFFFSGAEAGQDNGPEDDTSAPIDTAREKKQGRTGKGELVACTVTKEAAENTPLSIPILAAPISARRRAVMTPKARSRDPARRIPEALSRTAGLRWTKISTTRSRLSLARMSFRTMIPEKKRAALPITSRIVSQHHAPGSRTWHVRHYARAHAPHLYLASSPSSR